jgi:hypothetical protein
MRPAPISRVKVQLIRRVGKYGTCRSSMLVMPYGEHCLTDVKALSDTLGHGFMLVMWVEGDGFNTQWGSCREAL